MIKFGKGVVKLRVPIFIISLLLLIPAAIGMITTMVNYDILTYLPKDIETMKGQDILVNEFGTGAFSMCVLEDMENKDVVELKAKIEEVDHVKAVVWYDSIADLSLPMEFLPEDLVVVRRQQTARNGEIVVAMIEDEATVKRLSLRGGQVWLLPENDDYSPIDGTYAQILGKVAAVVRHY